MGLLRALTVTFSGIASVAAASPQFLSRPDFIAPKLNITVRASHGVVEKGFIFVTPYHGFGEAASGPEQQGAYIFQDDGELVWSSLGQYTGFVANFRPDVWHGNTYLRAFQGTASKLVGHAYGYHTLLGSDYQVAKVIKTRSDKLASFHEFTIVDGKTALIETPVPKYLSLKPWGGDDGQNWILSSGFQEVDVDTSEIIFDWQSIDHIDPKYSAIALNPASPLGNGRTPTTPWDYFHLNSVDKDDEGNYLISARGAAAIYKINATTGDVIWQLGGLAGGSSFQVQEEDRFGYQHDARFLKRLPNGNEIISLFDNGAHSETTKTHPFSRAQIFELNHGQGTAKAIKTFNAPDKLSASSQGNAQLLPNGNVFVNWGQAGAVTEFDENGHVVFHSYLDSAPDGVLVQGYRSFRANWTGLPFEDPAIAAFKTAGEKDLDVYVSWNGDTETVAWRFYVKHPLEEGVKLLGEVKRSGFETHALFKGVRALHVNGLAVLAESVGANNTVLGRTKTAKISAKGPQGRRTRAGESLWLLQEEL